MYTVNIKKPFQEIVELLEKHKNVKVESILPQILALASSKQASQTFLKNSKGQITHIFCYYHKKWEKVEHYGVKKHSHTGFNTMCREGVNQWTRQQKEARDAQTQLLIDVSEGKVSANNILKKRAEIEAHRKETIVPREDGHGWDSADEIK